MESLSRPTQHFAVKPYITLVKPGIIIGNAITAVAGFALASKGFFDVWTFLAMIEGLSLIIASACVLNNYIDREADGKMTRTKNRALVTGVIAPLHAIIYAVILGLFGTLILAFFTNPLTLVMALIGFFVYVVLYSFLKYRTIYGTLIGSIAGAVPPVVGYCAVTNRFDLAALILFIMIAMWQMPHFFAIAIYRLEDYTAALIPMFPIRKGLLATKFHMMLYVVAFMFASVMLTACGYTGYLYYTVATLVGFAWLVLSIKGFTCKNERRWARQMFFFSLVIVMTLSITIPLSVT